MSALRIPFLPSQLPVSGAPQTCCPGSKLAGAVIAMLLHGVASFARGRALTLDALVQHVLLGKPDPYCLARRNTKEFVSKGSQSLRRYIQLSRVACSATQRCGMLGT